MDDDLISDDSLSLERKSLLPGEGFFIPDSLDVIPGEVEQIEAVSDASVVAIADPDADGLTCVALLREAFGDVALLPTSPHELPHGLEMAAEMISAGTQVFICDLNPDSKEAISGSLQSIVDRAVGVRWFDHHQWDSSVAAYVEECGIGLVVGESDVECTADVALREIEYSFSDQFADLVAVVRDHDLWIRDDPRSDDIADYAYWTEPEEFIDTISGHGADLPEVAMGLLRERRTEKQDLIDRAVRRVDFHQVGSVQVAVTYGRCSQNEVAESLRADGADAVVVVKPAGSASIRGSDGFERCHEVAGLVDGGGHPRAAGCKPDVYRDMLDYAYHWTTQGAVAKQAILTAFHEVIDAE